MGEMTAIVREAKLPADELAILSFIAGLQNYEAGFEPDRRRDSDFIADHWREVQHRCAEKHGAIFIAEESGKPVGWAFAHEMAGELFVTEPERRHGFLAEIFVLPEARGSGHGSHLIEACEGWSRGRGHKLLTISVLAQNMRAIRAYEGAGYAPYTVTLRRYL
jgi:GNAT superfamily N-acetyltransferase